MEKMISVIRALKDNHTLQAIADKPLEKLVASAVGATFFDLALIYVLLIFLILLDIFTACIYQSSLLWKKMYDPKIVAKRGTLLNYARWIWQAHHWRLVDSFQLRDGFLSKCGAYGLLLLGAFVVDWVLAIRNVPQLALTICTGVLACTEYLSICENLDASGLSIAGQIGNLIKKKKEETK